MRELAVVLPVSFFAFIDRADAGHLLLRDAIHRYLKEGSVG